MAGRPEQGNTIRAILTTIIATFLLFIMGCASTGPEILVSDTPPLNTGAPRINKLVDLGGLDFALGANEINTHHSDERIAPGEWLLVKGTNLGVTEALFDNKAVAVNRYFGDSLLVQVPNGLSPLQEHELRLVNQFGEDSMRFSSHHYIVTTDTDGKAVHLIRTNRDEKGGVEEDWITLNSDAKRPMFNLISHDSRFLFSVNVNNKSDEQLVDDRRSYLIDIDTFHLAAPDEPVQIATFSVSGSQLIDVIISSDDQIVLLGKQSATLLDASDPMKLALVTRTVLPIDKENKSVYVDCIFLNNNAQLACLDTYNNRVVLLNAQSLITLNEFDLLPEKSIPLSVDLELDPHDSSRFWVLETPNYRITGSKVADIYRKVIKKIDVPDDKKAVYQMELIGVDGVQLQKLKTLPLPEDYAGYFSVIGQDGRLYISTTKTDFFTLDFENTRGRDLLKEVGRFLWDAVSFGRIIALDTTTGTTEIAASGVGIYYHLVDVPDIGPVFSLLKFGPSFSFPYITPNWGMGVTSTGTYAKRKMNKYAAFPPYSIGHVVYQY